LVSRVVAQVDVLAAAQAYARDIAENCAPAAVAVITAQVLAAADGTYADGAGQGARRDGQAHRLRRSCARASHRGSRNGTRSSARCRGRASDVSRCGGRGGPVRALRGGGVAHLGRAGERRGARPPARAVRPRALRRRARPREDEVGHQGAAAPVRPGGAGVPRRRARRRGRAAAGRAARARPRRDPRDRAARSTARWACPGRTSWARSAPGRS
jgi:hypothetical protein